MKYLSCAYMPLFYYIFQTELRTVCTILGFDFKNLQLTFAVHNQNHWMICFNS